MNTVLWANIFLGCFLFGFVLTVASLLFGFDQHHHAGGAGHHGPHLGHAHGPHAHAGGHSGSSFSASELLNYNTLVMFITWFGAAGFLMLANGGFGAIAIFSVAITAGVVGAIIVFLFLNKILMKGEVHMDMTEYYMPGTLAKVTSGIRSGGTGEIVYKQGGTRKTAGARSDEGLAHPQGEEVVIVRYEKGIAYVRSVGGQLESRA